MPSWVEVMMGGGDLVPEIVLGTQLLLNRLGLARSAFWPQQEGLIGISVMPKAEPSKMRWRKTKCA